jgi:hypothetical protein
MPRALQVRGERGSDEGGERGMTAGCGIAETGKTTQGEALLACSAPTVPVAAPLPGAHGWSLASEPSAARQRPRARTSQLLCQHSRTHGHKGVARVRQQLAPCDAGHGHRPQDEPRHKPVHTPSDAGAVHLRGAGAEGRRAARGVLGAQQARCLVGILPAAAHTRPPPTWAAAAITLLPGIAAACPTPSSPEHAGRAGAPPTPAPPRTMLLSASGLNAPRSASRQQFRKA